MYKEIRLTGSGGQGLMLAGIILAEAALLDGKYAIQYQSYGPEARGGSSRSEIIISDYTIDFIKVQNCDLLLCLTQEAYNNYGKEHNSLLILDERLSPKFHEPENIIKIPIYDTAVQKFGKPMGANIVALGAINGLLNLVTRESLLEAVFDRVPKGTKDINLQALEAGYASILKSSC